MTQREVETIMREVLLEYQDEAAKHHIRLRLNPIEKVELGDGTWELRVNAVGTDSYIIAQVDPQNLKVLDSKAHWDLRLYSYGHNIDSHYTLSARFANKIAEILARTAMLFGWRPKPFPENPRLSSLLREEFDSSPDRRDSID